MNIINLEWNLRPGKGVLKHGLIFYLGHYGPYHKDVSLVLWLTQNSDNLQEGWDVCDRASVLGHC